MDTTVKTSSWLIVFFALVIALFLANLWYGSVLIPWNEVLQILTGSNDIQEVSKVIVIDYRLPQAVTAIAVGISLGVAGLILQTVFRNPLAGPSVLGVSSGASLGVALVVFAGSLYQFDQLNSAALFHEISIVIAALLGALFVLAIIIFASQRISNVVTILIIGIMIGYTVSAIVGVIQFFSRAEELHAYILWGLGSFSKTTVNQSLFLLLASLGVTFVVFFYQKGLNALLLGDHYAKSIGVHVKKVQITMIIISGLLVALGTVFTGPIAFVGLAIPHLARNFFKTSDHRILIPAVILMGVALALACNLIARLPGYDTSLPINAVTSLVGAPVIIWVIVKRGKVKRA